MSSCRSEEWRPVVGFPGFEVSSLGRVRCSLPRNGRAHAPAEPRLLKPNPNTFGYLACSLRRGGRSVTETVHKLVLDAFVSPRPEGRQACHCNGDKTDNSLENLRWDSPRANAADRERHGRTVRGDRHFSRSRPGLAARGERHGNALLTGETVRTMLRMIDGGHTQTQVAAILKVPLTTVNGIVRGHAWKHISGPWLESRSTCRTA